MRRSSAGPSTPTRSSVGGDTDPADIVLADRPRVGRDVGVAERVLSEQIEVVRADADVMQAADDPERPAKLLDALDRALGGGAGVEPIGANAEGGGHGDVAVGVRLGVEA